MKALAASLACILFAGCLAGPRPTAEALRRERNERAIVAGAVRDASGSPVPGILVSGMPRDEDVGWSPPAETDANGRFRLSLIAPGNYGFLLFRDGRAVITSDPRDPSLLGVVVKPGETQSGLELLFLRVEREKSLAAESADRISPP